MKKRTSWLSLIVLLVFTARIFAEPQVASEPGVSACPALSDATILVIRHAEKPLSGKELTPAGQQRAEAYVNYFKTLTISGRPVKPDYLFATADSKNSNRPRLTLEPLSHATGLKLDNRFKNKDFAGLATEIRSTAHGKCILIAWHHGDLPDLLQALGADPANLLPDGKWPADVFDYLIVLRYDHEGRLVPTETKRISENLMPGDSK